MRGAFQIAIPMFNMTIVIFDGFQTVRIFFVRTPNNDFAYLCLVLRRQVERARPVNKKTRPALLDNGHYRTPTPENKRGYF